MSRHYFYNKINKCYLKVITCNSPCHHPLVFFFRISINCPGARLSCSEPEAAYADVTWAISEKKKNKGLWIQDNIKHPSSSSASSWYIYQVFFKKYKGLWIQDY